MKATSDIRRIGLLKAVGLLALVVATAAVTLWILRDPFEPRFNEQRDSKVVLSAWESWYVKGKADFAPLDALGPERAVRATVKLYNSYRPSLLFRWRVSLWRWWSQNYLGKWNGIDGWMSSATDTGLELPAESVQSMAVQSFEHFGSAAAPAVPVLVRRLEAHEDLGTIKTLGAIGPAAAPSLPILSQLAQKSRDPWYLYTVAENLRRIRPGSQVAVLTFGLNTLAHTNERVRAKAADLLALIGPPAAAGIPRLRELRSDPWAMVRTAAEQALVAIDSTNSVSSSRDQTVSP